MALAYGPGGVVQVPAGAILGNGAPSSTLVGEAGQSYVDQSTDPYTLYEYNGQSWQSGGNAAATTTTAGIIRIATDSEATTGTDNTIAMTPYTVGLIAMAGAPDATEVTKGIAMLATAADATTATDDTKIMTPLKVADALAGGTVPGSFTTLDASGAVTFASTGAISMTSDTASNFDTTGAGVDLTLASAAGRVIVNGEEAADNAITLLSAAGGIDANAALQISFNTSEASADSIELVSGGGIDLTATGAAGKDIDLTCTSGSINATAGEAIATAVVVTATNGGIDLTAGGGAGLDIDITNTSGSVNISAGEAAADAMVLTASGGGISASAAGLITLTSTDNSANAIYLHANGGTTETVKIHADQGTSATSINVLSDVGGVTIQGGVASADAINIVASNAAGGIDIDAGTAGFIVDTTGGISLDSAAASNFTATGAFDVTVSSTAGSIVVDGGEAAVDAIQLTASNAAGGVDINAGTGGITVDSGGVLSLDSAGATNLTATGAFDVTVNSTAGSIVVTGGQAAVDAVQLNASDAAGGIDINAGTGGITVDSGGVLSLDSAGATNLTATGAFDVTVSSTAGSIVIDGGEAAADAIQITASDAAGGIVLSAGTGNVSCDSNFVLSSVATQFQMNGGAVTDFIGTVTVANTNIAANDRIFLTRADENSSSALGELTITAQTASTSFIITALDASDGSTVVTGDTSIVNWFIVRQN